MKKQILTILIGTIFFSCSMKNRYINMHKSVCENGIDYYDFKLISHDSISFKLVVLDNKGKILRNYIPDRIEFYSNKYPSTEIIKSNIINKALLIEHEVKDSIVIEMIMVHPSGFDINKVNWPVYYTCNDRKVMADGLPIQFTNKKSIAIPK